MARPPKPAGRPSAVRRNKKKQSNPIEALRKLARAPAEIEQLERTYHEMFRTRNDRGAAILLGTFVEDALQQAMEQHDALFGSNSPLGNFANKIRVAFALDIIEPETFDNLNRIRVIRNAFAHSKIHISFKTKQVRDVCDLLVMPKDKYPLGKPDTEPDTPRNLFQSVCWITAKNLAMRASEIAFRRKALSIDIRAALARVERLIETLRNRRICGDETAAQRVLEYFRRAAAGQGDDEEGWQAVVAFAREHGLSLDYIIYGTGPGYGDETAISS